MTALPPSPSIRPFPAWVLCLVVLLTAFTNSPLAAAPQDDAANKASDEKSVQEDSAAGEKQTDEAAAEIKDTPENKETTEEAAPTEESLPEGHSIHGEAFNEGPRQAAVLMGGTGDVQFPVTTESTEVQAFINQGVGQLHGFWYFESERSFRQAAALDPECAVAYWGMAMSNRRNADRAKGFIKEAKDRLDGVSDREKRFIESLDRYLNAKNENEDEKKRRAERYISDLEEILFRYPDDLEAKAFLCEFIWSARREGIKTVSYLAVEALLSQIFAVHPNHPAHHYRIHHWDTKRAQEALESAALCGPSSPSIAHMWHMPGHIYSRLKRYNDAIDMQEASARVDHAHMNRYLVLPDQIHNFAHNNEWCIRNLIHVGRVRDAVALAKNMIEMPRHPKYNHADRAGSFKYGRERLLDVLMTWQLYEELVTLRDSAFLEPTGNDDLDLKTRRSVAVALAATGRTSAAESVRDALQSEVTQLSTERLEAEEAAEKKLREEAEDPEKVTDKAVRDARRKAAEKFRSDIRKLEEAVAEVNAHLHRQADEFDEAVEQMKKARGAAVEELVAMMLDAGQTEEAVKKIAGTVRTNQNEVRPLAAQVETLWAAGKKDEARKALEQLREVACTTDRDLPVMQRVTAIARECGYTDRWQLPRELAEDLGERPNFSDLGTFRWQPPQATAWSLSDPKNQLRRAAEWNGRPRLVVFYLGYGCLHCAEQLQALVKEADAFRKAGIEVIGISTDEQVDLTKAAENYEEAFPFTLVADPQMDVFRQYRCYDDFEETPLHGTFLIDESGRIRWMDISYEPFMDVEFLLKESKRLLAISRRQAPASTGNPTPVSAAEECSEPVRP